MCLMCEVAKRSAILSKYKFLHLVLKEKLGNKKLLDKEVKKKKIRKAYINGQ